jgi:CRISPR-associated endoribonuclease Cas6
VRILIRLRARADTAYDNAYHHNLRGRIGRALEGTTFDGMHGTSGQTRLVYSNPFPPRSADEGDERMVLIASPYEGILAHIAADLLETPEWNIGEMPFKVTDVTDVYPDVGEPGTTGTLDTGTGVCIRLNDQQCADYGIEPHSSGKTYWRPKHSLGVFEEQIEQNLTYKHKLHYPEHLPTPSETSNQLFESVEMIKGFWLPVTVTQGVTRKTYLTKWKLKYRVRDEHHRRHLNLALDCGIGERNELGFGFVNRLLPKGEEAATRSSEEVTAGSLSD